MHWWRFKALFDGLTEDTQFCKIIGYRNFKPYEGMPAEERQHYEKLKALYALPEDREERKHDEEITQALLRGEDISELLKR